MKNILILILIILSFGFDTANNIKFIINEPPGCEHGYKRVIEVNVFKIVEVSNVLIKNDKLPESGKLNNVTVFTENGTYKSSDSWSQDFKYGEKVVFKLNFIDDVRLINNYKK